MANILTLDPSETATGWAVVEAGPPGTRERILAYGCIVTAPNRVRATKSHDDIRRCSEIALTLRNLCDEYSPALIIAELPTGSQRATGAKAQGIVLGVLGSLRVTQGIPCEWVTPQAVKRATAHILNASKAEVQSAVLREWDDLEFPNKTEREAVCDALGALMAARQTDLYLMACQAAAPREEVA